MLKQNSKLNHNSNKNQTLIDKPSINNSSIDKPSINKSQKSNSFFDEKFSEFKIWWKDPQNKLFAFRIVLFIANFMLLLGIFIFFWLNFYQK